MKELEMLFKTMSEGLKTLSKGIDAVSDRLNDLAKQQKMAAAGATPKAKAKAKSAPKKTARKTSAKQPAGPRKPDTAIGSVYHIVARSKKGATTATIKQKTGFDDKKIHNIIYKLKKQGRIKSPQKGVYVKA